MGKGSSKAGGGGGGGGGGNSVTSIKTQLAGNDAELQYAQLKVHQYGSIRYGGTRTTRERFEMWNNEVKRLQNERNNLEAKLKKLSKSKKNNSYRKGV